MIYADNAATTELDIEAFEAMRPFLLKCFGNASQSYSFSSVNKRALKEARCIIADCIGANVEEIFFTSGGTEGDNWAVKCGAGKNGEIITSAIEHHAILNACKYQQNNGHNVIYLPVSQDGIVDADILKKSITSNTELVSIMFANNEIGTVQPIKKLAKVAHDAGALFHSDAVQAVGHVPIDVHELGVDLLSASAHKFNGPKGIGFVYIRKGINLLPFINGGGQERGLRAGTENVASIVAMAKALENNCKKIVDNAAYLNKLEDIIIDILSSAGIEYIRNGSDNRIPGNINLSFANCEGEVLLHRMDLKGICISTGSACNSIETQVSHVIRAIGVHERYAEGTIRISLGKNNTRQESEAIAKALVEIIK